MHVHEGVIITGAGKMDCGVAEIRRAEKSSILTICAACSKDGKTLSESEFVQALSMFSPEEQKLLLKSINDKVVEQTTKKS